MLLRIGLIGSICVAIAMSAVPQTRSGRQHRARTSSAKPQPQNQSPPPLTAEPTSEPTPIEKLPEAEALKADTNLVTVPVIATTIEGNYIPDLRQDELSISEDGEKQQVAFFATVNAPFHVVLVLDTSAGVEGKLDSIQRAALAFVGQLQAADRVKVISFDNEVRELSDFTSDRAALKSAISKTASGQGTKLYDAFELALSSMKRIKGRKAIVLFSDGVDWRSDAATFAGTLDGLDQEGVIVYPIRYETRAESERIARESAPNLPTIDVVRKPAGANDPTFPSDDPSSVPATERRPTTGPLGLPTADEIRRRQRERDRNTDRLPSDGLPPNPEPTSPRDKTDPCDTGTDPRTDPRSSDPTKDPRDDPRTDPRNDPRNTDRRKADPCATDTRTKDARTKDPRESTSRTSSRGIPRREDSVDQMLDQLYLTADNYLLGLANKSGGRLLRADTLVFLPDAFAKIAAELRTQYAIGYYPTNKTRDGLYRKIAVTTTRKNVVVRARPGYRAPSGG